MAHKNKPQHDKKYRDSNKEKLQQYFAAHYEENKQKKIDYQKEYYIRNKEAVLKRSREHHLKKSYGLSSDEYLGLVLKQNNCCSICGKPEHRLLKTGDVKPLSVDHNHSTGEVRELLCNDCNALLGFAKEDTEILQNAILYLQKYS